MARTHKTAAFASSRMVCQSCNDEQTHRVCSECNVNKPKDKMTCRQGTNKIPDRCEECVFPACVSCGTKRDAKDGPIGKRDKVSIERDGEKTRVWYCGI